MNINIKINDDENIKILNPKIDNMVNPKITAIAELALVESYNTSNLSRLDRYNHITVRVNPVINADDESTDRMSFLLGSLNWELFTVWNPYLRISNGCTDPVMQQIKSNIKYSMFLTFVYYSISNWIGGD